MERRFGEAAEILYHDVTLESVKKEYARLVDEIETRGLLYPVTVIDGTPVYDGAVSYPAILRAVQQKLERAAERA
jgi:disulfide oxidoreductase YuzD